MTERLDTDVLVVGGSLAGLSAAITAKEQNPALGVTVVEKYTSGYSGKANRGAGIILLLGDYAPEEFAQFYLKNIGLYLNNQTTLLKYASYLNESVALIDKWSGGKIDKFDDGKYRTLKWASKVVGKQERRQAGLRPGESLSVDSGRHRTRLHPQRAPLRAQAGRQLRRQGRHGRPADRRRQGGRHRGLQHRRRQAVRLRRQVGGVRLRQPVLAGHAHVVGGPG